MNKVQTGPGTTVVIESRITQECHFLDHFWATSGPPSGSLDHLREAWTSSGKPGPAAGGKPGPVAGRPLTRSRWCHGGPGAGGVTVVQDGVVQEGGCTRVVQQGRVYPGPGSTPYPALATLVRYPGLLVRHRVRWSSCGARRRRPGLREAWEPG